MSINVGVVGATGVVGQEFLKLLIERKFPVNELRLFASDRSHGTSVQFGGREVNCSILSEKGFQGLNVVFFSSGDDISRKWAPIAVKAGAFAIDNSAAFRMSDEHKLIVPEVNGRLIPKKGQSPEIIANPNCSTIQLVVALAPLAVEFGISSVKVATYQSVSGAGRDGKLELIQQLKSYIDLLENDESPNPQLPKAAHQCFAHQIAFNSLPHIGSFDKDGFCSEERKIQNETKKILGMPKLPVSAFTVRVPTLNGHGEAVWVELDEDVDLEKVSQCLEEFSGLQLITQSRDAEYPTVLQADGRNEVFVGRLHKDPENSKCLQMWVVADNLRKGAALNGIQIAEAIYL